MHVILWRFRARPGREARFEAAYGSDGAWVLLFRSGAGYLGSELMKGTDGTYLVLDRWLSEEAYLRFREERGERYAKLDADCRELRSEESLLGTVEI